MQDDVRKAVSSSWASVDFILGWECRKDAKIFLDYSRDYIALSVCKILLLSGQTLDIDYNSNHDNNSLL